jgi:hypothetical protein
MANLQTMPRAIRAVSLIAITLAGLLVVAACAMYLAQDWTALKSAQASFERLSASGADLRALFLADARQNIHRTNCFAEGIGVLLGGILAAIGLHGLCLLPRLGCPSSPN